MADNKIIAEVNLLFDLEFQYAEKICHEWVSCRENAIIILIPVVLSSSAIHERDRLLVNSQLKWRQKNRQLKLVWATLR